MHNKKALIFTCSTYKLSLFFVSLLCFFFHILHFLFYFLSFSLYECVPLSLTCTHSFVRSFVRFHLLLPHHHHMQTSINLVGCFSLSLSLSLFLTLVHSFVPLSVGIGLSGKLRSPTISSSVHRIALVSVFTTRIPHMANRL